MAQKGGEKDHVKLRGGGRRGLATCQPCTGRVRFQEAERKENWKNASLHRCRAVKRRTQRKGIYLLFAQIWHPLPLRLAETVRKKNSLSPLDPELGVEAWYCQGSPRGGACCEQSQTGGASRNRKSTEQPLGPPEPATPATDLSLDHTISESRLGFCLSQLELCLSHLHPRVLTNRGSERAVCGRGES